MKDAPYTTKILTITSDLFLSETPNPLPENDVTPYLPPEQYCESDDPDIVQLAQHLNTATPAATVENIFRWVASNITYTGYLKNPRGARYALKYKQGDCTEFMYLFMALCRAAGIPARGVGGYVVRKNALLDPAEYHNWAEFYDGGVWKIADPQKNVFVKNQSDYLIMRIIGQSSENPMGKYRRFRYAGEGITVKMN